MSILEKIKPLPKINNLDEIKANGFYIFGDSTVHADCFELPEFKQYVMPPVTVVNPDSSGYQILTYSNGETYKRNISIETPRLTYGPWIKEEK